MFEKVAFLVVLYATHREMRVSMLMANTPSLSYLRVTYLKILGMSVIPAWIAEAMLKMPLRSGLLLAMVFWYLFIAHSNECVLEKANALPRVDP